jgi:nucleoside-diphosphate-sugar epimerase
MQSSQIIGVLGANGVYGRHLVPKLIARGQRVRALVRRPEAAEFARACGAEVRIADLYDVESLTAALEGCELGINVATSLPGPSGRGDFAANDKLRHEGTPNWVEACKRAQVARIIQQSIAMVHATGSDEWADEDSAPASAPASVLASAIDAALSMERTARAASAECLILRGGLFYGPGTGFDDDWFARARLGKLRLPGDGQAYVSLVHVSDMAEATALAVERWPGASTLIVCEDQPARWRDVFSYITTLVGSAEPEPGGPARFPSFRVRNGRARELLGWRPSYPDHRCGLAR